MIKCLVFRGKRVVVQTKPDVSDDGHHRDGSLIRQI